MRDKQKKFMAILSFILIMLTTYAYSALATNLSITGEAVFRTPADIRVTNISINNANGATSEYANFRKDTITNGFVLNSSSSTMSYDVTITNSGLRDQAIYNLITQSSNNSGLNILIDGQPINEILPIIIPYGTSKTITITYSSSTPGRVDVVNKFDFRKVYYISYNTKGGSSIATQTKYENVDLVLTRDEPTLSGRRFLGWTDEQNGTIVKFSPGDTYTIDGDNKILYAIYSEDQYTITFDYNDGSTPSTTKDVSTGDPVGTLPTPTREGYTLEGWFTESTGGTQISAATVPNEDTTYYAHWTANELTFEDQTLNNGTYGTAYTSNAFTAPTNGTGNYTYTIKSGAPTGATINNTNRTLSLPDTTPAGTYNIVVTATDDDSGATKDVTMTIVINKATPVITLSSSSGTLNAGEVISITTTVKSGGGSISGTLTASSTNTDIASVAPTSTTITNANNSTGIETSHMITGVAGGTANITFNFTPTDTTNYNSAVVKIYTVTVKNTIAVTINKDSSAYNDSGMKVALYLNSMEMKSTIVSSGNTAQFSNILPGTYNIYAGKSGNSPVTLADTGNTITITRTDGIINNATSIVNYYTLTLNNSPHVTVLLGGGIYLSGQSANIGASGFTTDYSFDKWIVQSGNTPANVNSASTTVVITQQTSLTATAHPSNVSVTFDANGGTGTMSNQTISYNTATALNPNTYTKTGYKFMGWSTSSTGEVEYEDEEQITLTEDDTLYAIWQRVRAVDLYYDNTQTGMTCETAQCALDNISRLLTRAGARSEGSDYLCKRATPSQLHTETCTQTAYNNGSNCYSYGYYEGGSKGTSTITYGQSGTEGTLSTGDAFICDVNGDGTYNPTNEMFYYISDYYNTSTQTTNSDYATLVYYNNVSAGSPSNTTSYTYDSSNENWHGPRTAMLQLPDTTLWQDIGLYKNKRQILSVNLNTYEMLTSTSSGNLPSDFSYKGYSARLITYKEDLSDAIFLYENTQFSSPELGSRGFWSETPASSANSIYGIDSRYAKFYINPGYENLFGVRPVIDVKKSDINLNFTTKYDVNFNKNGGTGTMSSLTVIPGDSVTLTTNTFTRTNYTFTGWNTKEDGSGTSYANGATITPDSSITLYAMWEYIPYKYYYPNISGTTTLNSSWKFYVRESTSNGVKQVCGVNSNKTVCFNESNVDFSDDQINVNGTKTKALKTQLEGLLGSGTCDLTSDSLNCYNSSTTQTCSVWYYGAMTCGYNGYTCSLSTSGVISCY